MNEHKTVFRRVMSNGTRYRIQPCVEPGTSHTPDYLRTQISEAIGSMSSRSLWARFAAPVHRLSQSQLEYLTDLDGRDRVAWCAALDIDGREKGIGLGRYVRLDDDRRVAEFALTVIDEYQRQGVGSELFSRLVETARRNGIRLLRGQVMAGNRAMLSLCRKFNAVWHRDPSSSLTCEVTVHGR